MDWSTQTLLWDDIVRCSEACFGGNPETTAGVLLEVRKKALVAWGAWIGGDVRGVMLAKIIDDTDNRKSFLIYALNGDMGLDEWREAFAQLEAVAKETGCSFIRAGTQLKSVEKLAGALGFKSQYTLWKEV